MFSSMKTAISIPDAIFEAAEELSGLLGLSRSELYAQAIQSYVEGTLGHQLPEFIDMEETSETADQNTNMLIPQGLPIIKY